MLEFDVAVVGGGVVGLAVAADLAPSTGSLVLLERHDDFGRETSSRNSEVIHAGIYYPPNSLKARLCVEGRRALYALCAEHGIPHRKCGKVIVAAPEEDEGGPAALLERGRANDVEGLRLLTPDELRRREPHVRAGGALLSEETGIVDSHRLMAYFAKTAESHGADLIYGAAVTGLEPDAGGWRVRYEDTEEAGVLRARAVVNAAGLGAQAVMGMAGLDPDAMGLRLHPCKGEYFSVSGAKRTRVNGLVYPLPRHNLLSLGIHTVIDLGGGLKLGPSAFYVDKLDYDVDPSHAADFLADVRARLPFLDLDDLAPAMSGIRPKLAGPGEGVRDFHIAHEENAGAPGFFNLCGIESPGLTASPTLGAMVGAKVRAYLS